MARTLKACVAFVSIGLIAACTAETSAKRTAITACEAAVLKAATVLPDGLVNEVTGIEAGKSGTAVSCAVQSADAHLMIDATITCSGSADELAACTAIDAVQTMEGVFLYP